LKGTGLDIACGALVFIAAGLLLRLDELGHLMDMTRSFLKRQVEALGISGIK